MASVPGPARTNIAPERTAFIGRERDLALVKSCLERSRLVTILGAGGSGKTRLARRLGTEEIGAFPGGVWFCDLTEALTGEDLAARVGLALGAELDRGAKGGTELEALGHVLAARGELLLILDNFEQLVSVGADSVARWLERAPELRILVTSRQALALEGEVLCELPPLTAPDAAKLFEDSARAVRPSFEPNPADSEAIGRIVKKLDGLPLAIKLAARLADVLTPSQIDARLERRFDLLRDDRRDTPARHATMRAAVAWSWDMLTPHEQLGLAQCSAFHGSFTFDAAEAVVVLEEGSPSTLEVVRELRQKSLLRVTEPGASDAPLRIGLYETVREFVSERLAALGIADAVEARHAAYYIERAEGWAAAEYTATESKAIFDLALESDNLLAAHRRMLERDPALAARAALALHPLFRARGPAGRHVALLHAAVGAARASNDPRLVARTLVARGEAWRSFGDNAPALRDLDEALDGAAKGSALEGEALYQRASVLWLEGRHVDASADARRALELFRSSNDRAREGLALSLLGAIAQALGQFAEAREHHEAALAIHRALGHKRAEGLEYNRLAHLAFRTGRTKENHGFLARALSALREAGDRMNEALCTHNLGYQLLDEGRIDEAMRHLETALGTYRELGMRRNEGAVLAHIGAAHLDAGDLPAASSYFEQALFIHSSIGDKHTESFTLRHFARLRIEQGDWEEADRLVAAGLEAARASANAQAEAFLLGYRAATLAMRDDLEGATELIRVAREGAGRYEGMRVPEAVEILEGCVDIARANRAQARGDDETSRILRAKARARCESSSIEVGAVRHAQRVVSLALDGEAELRPPAPVKPGGAAFVIRLSADGRKITLGEHPTVDFSRRRAQRAILHRLISHREERPGDALSWSELFEAGWPGERVQVEAGFGRVRTTVWALRKLGLFAVLVTRDDGYLLDPRVEIVREPSGT